MGRCPETFDNKKLEDSRLLTLTNLQGATVSIFKKAELKGLTANSDAYFFIGRG
jgi:hypothetical protein